MPPVHSYDFLPDPAPSPPIRPPVVFTDTPTIHTREDTPHPKIFILNDNKGAAIVAGSAIGLILLIILSYAIYTHRIPCPRKLRAKAKRKPKKATAYQPPAVWIPMHPKNVQRAPQKAYYDPRVLNSLAIQELHTLENLQEAIEDFGKGKHGTRKNHDESIEYKNLTSTVGDYAHGQDGVAQEQCQALTSNPLPRSEQKSLGVASRWLTATDSESAAKKERVEAWLAQLCEDPLRSLGKPENPFEDEVEDLMEAILRKSSLRDSILGVGRIEDNPIEGVWDCWAKIHAPTGHFDFEDDITNSPFAGGGSNYYESVQ